MTFVYAIESGDAVKIGWANNPVRRLSELNVGSPGSHRLLGFIKSTKIQERELHKLLKEYRIRGEWFIKSRAVNHFISQITPFVSRPAPLKNIKTGAVAHLVDSIGMARICIALGGLTASTVSSWKIRGSIPVEYWPKIIEVAGDAGKTHIDYACLVAACAARKTEAA